MAQVLFSVQFVFLSGTVKSNMSMVQIALLYTKFSSAGKSHRLSGAFENCQGVLLQILLQKWNGLDLLHVVPTVVKHISLYLIDAGIYIANKHQLNVQHLLSNYKVIYN